MPTARKRHSITETPPVEAALDALRSAMPGARIDLAELVILGAGRKLSELVAGRELHDALVEDLARRVEGGLIGADLEAAEEVRRTGWSRA